MLHRTSQGTPLHDHDTVNHELDKVRFKSLQSFPQILTLAIFIFFIAMKNVSNVFQLQVCVIDPAEMRESLHLLEIVCAINCNFARFLICLNYKRISFRWSCMFMAGPTAMNRSSLGHSIRSFSCLPTMQLRRSAKEPKSRFGKAQESWARTVGRKLAERLIYAVRRGR